jgi:Holliday junction resolvase-like predicted endonuclease
MEALKKYLEKRSWKDFESFISEVFEIHGYKVRKNVRLKYLKNLEIDIIAEKRDVIFLVECKKWKKEYSKERNLKKVVEKHKEKLENFGKFTYKRVYGLIIFLDTTFSPKVYDKIFIISIDFLNSFILEFESR